MTGEFDRVKPRTSRPSGQAAVVSHDAQGKRALFSSAPDEASTGLGTAEVECSRCNERTVLTLGKALRAALPSLHLGVRLGHGEDVCVFTVLKRDYPTYMRCPACHRPSWVRLTISV
ncbi:MAG TPA: hypothetical protein VMH41_04560 [Mycobacteriales bacterium]|nr:hypothetical protein [Mycobacteriales bacterium]